MFPQWINQLYTWFIFGIVYILSWDGALTVAVNRLNTDIDAAFTPDSVRVLRRPYLIAIGAYAVVLAWFNIAFYMLIMYCACLLMCMTAPIGSKLWENIMRALALPSVVFNCVGLEHAAFHGTIMLVTIATISHLVGWYFTEDDLLSESTVHSKAVRAMFVVPGTMGAAYAIYAAMCVLCCL